MDTKGAAEEASGNDYYAFAVSGCHSGLINSRRQSNKKGRQHVDAIPLNISERVKTRPTDQVHIYEEGNFSATS
ncbi:hypothetical protein CDAR_517381 [Caerostris darwini]|uniref:Uncharacterized protein n=1 Tax=Caerostris darwini TaxID=1538125 RepID=A0AAV4SSS9_9ARAC|nr:hypothetical protein CDAR_517381 [Caerostris darwini]